ncbi:hypothetical protein KIH74_06870 [Kineosporia sp. J2-2]|uniref:Uncharacterized protein n=1 Tax=Kineosporia corallincola TaxID=2835133 RepID=A0ABS5TC35_9ACTN|nr:hypothetical protein [Kineosporia corallincola]MBT0768642.1 hypothetical protein [Kineosporia corallincola]
MAEYLRLCALEEPAGQEALEDAEDLAEFRDYEAREAAGTTSHMTMDELRQHLGLER